MELRQQGQTAALDIQASKRTFLEQHKMFEVLYKTGVVCRENTKMSWARKCDTPIEDKTPIDKEDECPELEIGLPKNQESPN